MVGGLLFYYMKYHTKLTFKVYWQQIRNYKLSALVMLLSVIGASVVSVVIPLYLKNFFDTLAGSGSREMIVDSLISILLIIAGLELLQWGFWRSATFTAAYFYAKVMADLSNYCFQYLHRHSFSFFNNNFTGSLVRRVNKFVKAFDGIADRFTWDLLPLVVNIIIIIAVLVNVSASQNNEKSDQALLLKNIGAIAWAQSETIYCSSNPMLLRYSNLFIDIFCLIKYYQKLSSPL